MAEYIGQFRGCTSKEESRELLKNGLSKDTADMYYSITRDGEAGRPDVVSGGVYHNDIPAWSLTKLIELMNDRPRTYKVSLYNDDTGGWICSLYKWDTILNNELESFCSKDIMNAVVYIMNYMLTNGLLYE